MSLFFSVLENRLWWATVIPRCPYGTRIVAKWNHQWSTRSELLTARQSLEEKKNNATSWYTLLQYLFHPSLLLLFKAQIFWEGHINFWKSPTLFWRYKVLISKEDGRFFQILWPFHNIWTFTTFELRCISSQEISDCVKIELNQNVHQRLPQHVKTRWI